jgi:hypothetical protein
MSLALVLFITAALFGFHLLKHVLKNAPTPKGSLLFHSIFAAAGLAILIYNVWEGERGHLVTALAFLVVAALGGFVMGFTDLILKKNPPRVLAIIHPILAVTGVIFLLLFLFGSK